MPCPFPAMDPYLEDSRYWPAFQDNLMAALSQAITVGLADRYRIKPIVRTYTTELVLFTSVTKETHNEPYLEIRDRKSNALVTVVDCVSPKNRTTVKGKDEIMATRTAALSQKASVVEIDLVTQGKPPVDLDRSGLPDHVYTITLTRGTHINRHQVYPLTLEKRLPAFKVPLAADDRDSIIDLQLAFARAYEGGQFAKVLDYQKPLPAEVVLKDDIKSWVGTVLAIHNIM